MPPLEADLRERIAVLENQQEELARDVASLGTRDERIEAKLDALLIDHARYKGLVGGIVLVCSAVVAFFKLAWEDIMRFFK